MTLVVIVISLILEHVLGRWQHLRQLPWFSRYRERLFGTVPPNWQDGYPGAAMLLLLPVVALLLLHWLLGGYAWGLWQLLLSAAVLTYCLGPEAFNEKVDAYLHACESHNRLDAREIAQSLVGEDVPDNPHQQAQAVTTAILYEGNVRVFAVVLWFILLGPAGALLYRCSTFLQRDARTLDLPTLQEAADRLHALLDWLPSRLLALSFFLAGSFDDALKAWRQVTQAEQDLAESNRSIVVNTGCGAMRHEIDEAFADAHDSDDQPQEEEYDLYWVRTARGLVLRALIIWLTVIALLTMAGWFI